MTRRYTRAFTVTEASIEEYARLRAEHPLEPVDGAAFGRMQKAARGFIGSHPGPFDVPPKRGAR